MIAVVCGFCGKTFTAKRKTAQYCCSQHRVEAKRQRDRDRERVEAAPPPRREGAQIYAMPAPKPKSAGGSGFYANTLAQLQEAGVEDSPGGMSALFAAQMLDSGVQDTMSSMAAMLREYKASMKDALGAVRDAKSPLDEIREALKLA